ncbi:DNA recombination protein RmuC [Lichenifustis flavocetrariae]|uniref:DNA recombination protein RmuC homolog n=1 Tax=Lichenifustis flavocetrariae TaxID=2949735 RepID=A0AA42CJP8_9HYPH|nr:DNA recombination protein RmuC [Lichenifustis flavocetrariae]MCW6509783.1 DNA recombination protein RmuC [Lichenifustis flavocetrariae]
MTNNPLPYLPFGVSPGLMAVGVSAAVVVLVVTWAGLRRRREAALYNLEDLVASLHQANAELTGRVRTMGEALSARQSDLARLVTERLDSVNARMGQTLDRSAHRTGEGLARLHERLAVIDAAQARLTGLTEEVVGLKDILANKQARGAYGQGRMEAIVRDGLPADAYAFQPTLSNRTRPDCTVKLPGDRAALVIDAKFPLEAFQALKAAEQEHERAQAGARVRTDMGKHIRDIAERYLIPGETQDTALMFVPSESVFADLSEHFPDVLQKASRARVMVVSPTLLTLAIQLMRSVARDARMREQAHLIQAEVRGLTDDVRRLGERVGKLDDHFRLARKDVSDISSLADRIVTRGDRIDAVDYAVPPVPANDQRVQPPGLFDGAAE